MFVGNDRPVPAQLLADVAHRFGQIFRLLQRETVRVNSRNVRGEFDVGETVFVDIPNNRFEFVSSKLDVVEFLANVLYGFGRASKPHLHSTLDVMERFGQSGGALIDQLVSPFDDSCGSCVVVFDPNVVEWVCAQFVRVGSVNQDQRAVRPDVDWRRLDCIGYLLRLARTR